MGAAEEQRAPTSRPREGPMTAGLQSKTGFTRFPSLQSAQGSKGGPDNPLPERLETTFGTYPESAARGAPVTLDFSSVRPVVTLVRRGRQRRRKPILTHAGSGDPV